jgi:hypothetical protein
LPREGKISDLVQANDLPPRWTTRLAGPFGSPRSRRQDATSPLLQPTFTSRALDIDITSGDCPPVAVSKPTAPSFQAGPRGGEVLPPRQPGVDAGPPRGHPASSGCALDGTPAGFGSIDSARTLSRPCGRAPALFRLTGRPVDRHPLIPTATTGPGPGEGAAPNRLITARRGHVNARRLARDRDTFHRTGPSRTPSREPVAARCTGWPACAASARFHRCTKTPARPLLVPLSRNESRPRAPLRLLQVDVSTSTTTDHPNIALRAVRGRDGCLGSTGSRLPIETAAEAPRGQGSGKPMPDIPGRDCSRRRLRPNPDRSRHLVSQDAIPRRSGATR